MEIPAVFASWTEEGGLEALASDGVLPSGDSRRVPFRNAVSLIPRSEERFPVVVADWDSLGTGEFREKVVKRMRVRGSDIWFMTWIEDVDDLMDAFNTVAARVLVPVHSVASDDDMEDICAVSDGAVPAVFVRNGRALTRGAPESVIETLYRLEGVGFATFCVLDADSSLSPGDWREIAERFPPCVPFVPDASRAPGFDRVVTPLLLRCSRG